VKLLLPYDKGQDAFFKELRKINDRDLVLDKDTDLTLDSCKSVQDLVY
jgi:hypothetical protein